MDGIETCRRLKADPTTAHIPILFLTGSQDEETAVVALAAGGNDFLHKPYSRSIMLARVSSQVAINEIIERYVIRYTIDEERVCSGSVTVCIPHDERSGANCIDRGPLLDSLVP